MSSVGILGTGIYLPETVRRNDWWPEAVVDGWTERKRRAAPSAAPHMGTEGRRRVMAAMRDQALDPFLGAVERRVMHHEMSVHDMEEAAARAAITNAGIDPTTIDLVLTHVVVPDSWLGNPACTLHHRLGLSRACLSLHIDGAALSFLMQLQLAESMIRAKRATRALLVQACAATRLMRHDDPRSPLVGDGASAVVVGGVSDGRGLHGFSHFTDGSLPRTLVMSVPGSTWYADGPAWMHVADEAQMAEVFLQTADVCKEATDAALASTQRSSQDIDFLCIYQGTPWLAEVVSGYLGVGHARYLETFTRFGYLSSAMIPLNMSLASSAGVLREGDTVLLTGGGTGMTFGAAILTWGR